MVLGLAFLLTSCSTFKLVYNQSDDLTYWWLDGYVDFVGTQKDFTRQALKEIHQWHRQNELPKYLALIERLREVAPHDITPSQACLVIDEAKAHALNLLHHAEPASAQLVAQLSAAQLLNVQKRYEKSNKSWREDFLEGPDAKRLKFRVAKAADQLEDLYGDLSATQNKGVTQWMAHSGFDPHKVDAERLRRQAESLRTFELMKQASTPLQAQALLRVWIDQDFDSPDESYRAYMNATTLKNCEGFAQLHNSTSAAQRKHLAERLRKYEADLKVLIANK